MSTEIPIVNWLPGILGGNIVQILVRYEKIETPHLWFPWDGSSIRHAEVLEDLLTQLNIPFDTMPSPINKKQIPVLTGGRYRVVGMGKCRVHETEKKATMYGSSKDYQINIDKNHLNLIRTLEPEWEITYADNF